MKRPIRTKPLRLVDDCPTCNGTGELRDNCPGVPRVFECEACAGSGVGVRIGDTVVGWAEADIVGDQLVAVA